jgi:hypothetical protein
MSLANQKLFNSKNLSSKERMVVSAERYLPVKGVEITSEELKKRLPSGLKTLVNDELLYNIKTMIRTVPVLTDSVIDSLGATADLLTLPRFNHLTMNEISQAAVFCTFIGMGMNSVRAFKIAYPEKYSRLSPIQRKSTRYLVNFSKKMYTEDKTVQAVKERLMTPVHIKFSSAYEDALTHLYQIGVDPKVNPRDRVAALNALAANLKAPEKQKIELDIGQNTRDYLKELRSTTDNLAENQLELIKAGKVSVKDIIDAQIIDQKKEKED